MVQVLFQARSQFWIGIQIKCSRIRLAFCHLTTFYGLLQLPQLNPAFLAALLWFLFGTTTFSFSFAGFFVWRSQPPRASLQKYGGLLLFSNLPHSKERDLPLVQIIIICCWILILIIFYLKFKKNLQPFNFEIETFVD